MTLEIAIGLIDSALERAARRCWGLKVEHFAEEWLIRMFDWAQKKSSEQLRVRKERAQLEVGAKDTRQEAACPNLVNWPLTGVRLSLYKIHCRLKYSRQLSRRRKGLPHSQIVIHPNLQTLPLIFFSNLRLGCRPHSHAMPLADCARFLQRLAPQLTPQQAVDAYRRPRRVLPRGLDRALLHALELADLVG
jgi:hypothetical protein